MNKFSRQVISWFRENGRELPWRQTSDPYLIWLSEVILQQTRVAQGMAYFHRFCQRFPDVQSLAKAPEDEILEVWQGLGYYSRARNMHAAAKWIVNEGGGVFPSRFEELLKLKGVGRYTAAAIASFAFHEDQVVVDGNVIRVFSRFFGIQEDVRQDKTVAVIRERAEDLLPSGHSWEYNQSIMELGALLCLPSKPDCTNCPVNSGCVAFAKGLQSSIPFKSKGKERRRRYFNYLLLEADDSFYFQKRMGGDIWEGLYEPLLFESDRLFGHPDEFIESFDGQLGGIQSVQVYPATKHILSHQELWVRICRFRLETILSLDSGRWVKLADFNRLPKPVIFSKILGLKIGSQLPLTF